MAPAYAVRGNAVSRSSRRACSPIAPGASCASVSCCGEPFSSSHAASASCATGTSSARLAAIAALGRYDPDLIEEGRRSRDDECSEATSSGGAGLTTGSGTASRAAAATGTSSVDSTLVRAAATSAASLAWLTGGALLA